jgi:LysM repeat protein
VRGLWQGLILAGAGYALLACSASQGNELPSATPTLRPYETPSPSPASFRPTLKATRTSTPAPTATPVTHEIAKDETLLGIALRYGLSLDVLLAANPGIDPHFLTIGQRLIIPGPEGGSFQEEIPSATPLPLGLGSVRCFTSASSVVQCLAVLNNPGDQAVEAASIEIALYDAQGQKLASTTAYTPLNLVGPGVSMPLEASFAAPPGDWEQASARILSAVPVNDLHARYLDLQLTHQDTPQAGGRLWISEGTVELSAASQQAAAITSVLAVGYNDSGTIVGFSKWVRDSSLAPGKSAGFRLTVFSLQGIIARLNLIAEAQPAAADSAAVP